MTDMKRHIILLVLAAFIPACMVAQDWKAPKYLKGAVPQNKQGVVYFKQDCNTAKEISKAKIFTLLREYVADSLVAGPNATKGQCRIVEEDAEKGILAVRMDEQLWFKRSAWTSHGTRFLYDLVFSVQDNAYTVEMQRLRYLYKAQENENVEPELRTAEQWITDSEALDKKGRLLRRARQFRVFTIERKNEVFEGAWKAVTK